LGSVVVLLLAMGMNGGCGGRFYDEISYEYPNWTPEGLIYCQKATTHYREYGGIGGRYNETLGTDYSYVIMDTDGNNETTLPYKSYPYFSPKGTYVALINGNTISIIRRSDNTQVYSFAPTTESIKALDWGPYEDKLVYLKSKGDIDVININGSGDFNIATSGESVSWKHGNKIVFEYLDGLYTPTAVINPDGTGRIDLGPQSISSAVVSLTATNEIYGKHGSEYGYVDISTVPPQYYTKISPFDGYLPKLNARGDKVVYSKYMAGGIWVINIDGTGLKRLR